MSALLQITQQRNEILGELDSMTHALVNVYSGSHPLVRQFAETIMEDHREAFWESLPYDFANMLGEEWSHMDADALYAALTIDLDEKEEGRGDYGYTREELVIFRKKVLASIRQLHGKS